MATKDWKGIAVIIEQTGGVAENISWELLGKARELADKDKQDLIAIVLGESVKDIAQEAVHRGANLAVYANHKQLAAYRWETYADVTHTVLEKYKPSIFIVGATPNGRDLAGRLAVRMHTGLTADVVQLTIEKGLLLGSVPGFGGSVLAQIKCETARPQMATVRPGIFEAIKPDKKRKGKVEEFKVTIEDAKITTDLLKQVVQDTVDISKAERILAAGRGIGDNTYLIEELAELMKAEIGATRPLCDDALFGRERQVGSTGVTVKPELCLVAGVSGATHFTSGIKDSGTVIAINTDPEAIIFEYADYIVEGDLHKVLPELIDVLKARLLQVAK